MDDSVRVSEFVGLCDPFWWRATHPFMFCFTCGSSGTPLFYQGFFSTHRRERGRSNSLSKKIY